MLKITIDEGKTDIQQNLSCEKQMADEIGLIIDRIIIDEYIKVSPALKKVSSEKQIKLIIDKRKEICNFIINAEVDLDYVYCNESSDIYENSDILKSEKIQFN